MLIVLDNAASVAHVRPLLPGTAGCIVLVTSRSRLSGLVARDGAFRISLDVLTDTEAIELLRRATEGFRPPDDQEDLEELARLCAKLPLALRIAAERAGSRPRMPLRRLIDDLRDESVLWESNSGPRRRSGRRAHGIRMVLPCFARADWPSVSIAGATSRTKLQHGRSRRPRRHKHGAGEQNTGRSRRCVPAG
jgi:hypothetical protein